MTAHATPSEGFQQLATSTRHALECGDTRLAAELAARLLQLAPGHPEAHYLSGICALERQQLPHALEHLHRAASQAPREPAYAVQFARALARAHRPGDALEVANVASTLDPDDPAVLGILGTVYMQCHAPERAAPAFRRACELAPDNAAHHFNKAVSLVFAGHADAAEDALEACLQLDSEHWQAYGIRSRLRRQTAERNHLDALLALAERTQPVPQAQRQLHMALGKEYEDLGDYAAAFRSYTAGNAAARALAGYALQADEAIFQALFDTFPEPPPATGNACLSREPIFVFGMPRTGTTLVERILSSHPEVSSAGELQHFGVALERLSGARSTTLLSPEVVRRGCQVDPAQLGDRYLASTRPLTHLKPRFVDKLPHNFLYAGFIARALPHASMICLRRHPLDTCLANFREPFSETSPFHGYAFDLLDTGRYYLQFDRLMAHWRRLFPGRILELDYEDLVYDPEGAARRLLAHCGLPWDDACLHFERNRSAATTASALQVRAPIHRDSVMRWKHYAQPLLPLQVLLERAGIDCGD
ncbi:sulfotransferase [Fulvimonas sp. R45]|uniref:tetratricopeptide repeat-containing sulfotransferase family protein n=1 Tax=Fulvimonas sp. R45 TaxID=3045937 RepID=UPI00265D8211|nr:tetratricopeptide repeat-containing sulfotransferase family protein [Fulvimonas sp. R45]MDO1530011.1 sulfotransferase [Fulvimonas sp. R45]